MKQREPIWVKCDWTNPKTGEHVTEVLVRCNLDELRPLKAFQPHPKNRNDHSQEQIERLALVFHYQGIRKPIYNSTLSGKICAGHGRLLTAKHMKLEAYPAEWQGYNDEAQEYADVAADNALAMWAELDLAAIGKDILDFGPDFDVENLGIKDFTIDPPIFEPGTEEDQGQLDEKKIVILECPHCREHFEQQQAKIIA